LAYVVPVLLHPAYLCNPYRYPPRMYLCPYGGELLYWIPGRDWYCPIHGFISRWRYRFI